MSRIRRKNIKVIERRKDTMRERLDAVVNAVPTPTVWDPLSAPPPPPPPPMDYSFPHYLLLRVCGGYATGTPDASFRKCAWYDDGSNHADIWYDIYPEDHPDIGVIDSFGNIITVGGAVDPVTSCPYVVATAGISEGCPVPPGWCFEWSTPGSWPCACVVERTPYAISTSTAYRLHREVKYCPDCEIPMPQTIPNGFPVILNPNADALSSTLLIGATPPPPNPYQVALNPPNMSGQTSYCTYCDMDDPANDYWCVNFMDPNYSTLMSQQPGDACIHVAAGSTAPFTFNGNSYSVFNNLAGAYSSLLQCGVICNGIVGAVGCTDDGSDPTFPGRPAGWVGPACNECTWCTVDNGTCCYNLGCSDFTGGVFPDMNGHGTAAVYDCNVSTTVPTIPAPCSPMTCVGYAADNYDPCACCLDVCNYPPVTYGCTDLTAYGPGPYNVYELACNGSNPTGNPIPCIVDATGAMQQGSNCCCCYVGGCTDPNNCYYDPNACWEDGSCATLFGCTDPTMSNYDSTAECPCNLMGTPNDCCVPHRWGCMDPSACNYDILANHDYGFPPVPASGPPDINDPYYCGYPRCIDSNNCGVGCYSYMLYWDVLHQGPPPLVPLQQVPAFYTHFGQWAKDLRFDCDCNHNPDYSNLSNQNAPSYTGITPTTSGCCGYVEKCNDIQAINYDPTTGGGSGSQLFGGCLNSNGIIDVRNTSCCNYRITDCKYVIEDASPGSLTPVLTPYVPGQYGNNQQLMWEVNKCVPKSFYPGGIQNMMDWNGTNSVVTTGWLYETWSEAIYNNVFCNSGQTCCPFEREPMNTLTGLGYEEYRSDYHLSGISPVGNFAGSCTQCCHHSGGAIGSPSPYTFQVSWLSITPAPIGLTGTGPVSFLGYDSIAAYLNARDSGIMCNCVMQKPSLHLTWDAGQQGPALYNVADWPPSNTPWGPQPQFGHNIITDDIRNHPPNFYINVKICGYPGDFEVTRLASSQFPAGPGFPYYAITPDGRQYGESYNRKVQDRAGVAWGCVGSPLCHRTRTFYENEQYLTFQLPLGGNIYDLSDPTSLIPNFGLAAGINVVELVCNNGKKIKYRVCIPHNTQPYGQPLTQWMNWNNTYNSNTGSQITPYFITQFYNCKSGPHEPVPDNPIEDA